MRTHIVSAAALQGYLERSIPLYSAMRVDTRAAGRDEVVLAAPLAPNVNHQATAFGGSIAALATLACWGWLWTFLRETGPDARLVVARSEVDYLKPVATELVARCAAPDDAVCERFMSRFTDRGRGRIALEATIEDAGGIVCARYSGQFVASRP